jgi:threonine/homoserine/homoserine lactone efflux protein
MAVTAMAAYTVVGHYLQSVAAISFVFALICLPCVAIWTLFGAGLKRWLSDERHLRVFNIAMGLALVVSLWPIIAE